MLFSIKNHKIWKWKKIGNLIISCIIYHYYLLFYNFYWFIFCFFIKPVLFKIYVLERCGATWWCNNDCIKFVITRTELFLLFLAKMVYHNPVYPLTQFLHVIVVYTYSRPLYSLTQFLHVIVVYTHSRPLYSLT